MHEGNSTSRIQFGKNHSLPLAHQRIRRSSVNISSQRKGNCMAIERDVHMCPAHLNFEEFSTFSSVANVLILLAGKLGLEENVECQ